MVWRSFSIFKVVHVNVHHFVIAPASNAKKVQPYLLYINLSMLNCTKVNVFNKKCVWTLVDKELKWTVFIPGFSGSITKVTKLQKVQLLKYCTKFHRFTRITDHQDGCRNKFTHTSLQHLQTPKPYVIMYKSWRVTKVAKQCKIH